MKRFIIGLILFVVIAGLAVGAAFGVNALARNRIGVVSNTDNDNGSFQYRGPGMMHQGPRGGMMEPWGCYNRNNDDPDYR
jgi:hypothetical protein